MEAKAERDWSCRSLLSSGSEARDDDDDDDDEESMASVSISLIQRLFSHFDHSVKKMKAVSIKDDPQGWARRCFKPKR